MQWCHGRFRPDPHDDADDAALFLIDTPEGPHIARSGDWIIRGVKGEFYPCKPDIFAATYEEVRDEPN